MQTLEKSLLPYIIANIPNTPIQHGYKTQHATVTALDTLNNTVTKRVQPNGPLCANNHCSTRYEQSFDTINIHTLIRKLLQTNNHKVYRKLHQGTQSYTTYRNHTSIRQFKTSVPKGGVLSPTLFSIYTVDLPPARTPIQAMACADDNTITSTHTQARVKQRNTYSHTYIKFFSWTKHNNLTQNPEKTTCTLFTPDPAQYTINLDPKINNTALPMATHPKILGPTLDLKLTYSPHIHNISVHAHKPLHIIKALTATGWGKQKETPMANYKKVRPALEYDSSIWSSLASSTSINKLQVMPYGTLRTATGCTQDTNVQHLHNETLIHEHLQLYASQYKQKTQYPSHALHKHTSTLQG